MNKKIYIVLVSLVVAEGVFLSSCTATDRNNLSESMESSTAIETSISSQTVDSVPTEAVSSTYKPTNQETTEETTQATEAPTTAATVSGEDRIVVPFYYFGDQLGTIRIPSVDIEVGVYQGDTEDEFQLGAGHFLGSFLPGQDGNIVLAAHRTSYFRNFEDLKTGDQVEFETTYGLFTYQVREIQILEKKDFDLIAAETDQEQLTMYTCYPFTYIGHAPKRYVVMCDLIGSELNT